jgi:SOS-response transcriptional repressor LexA
MKPLTQCEEELLVYLKSCERCPSIDEMADTLRKSKSHIHRVLGQLETKGFIACIAPNAKRRPTRSLVLTLIAFAPDYNPLAAELSDVPTSILLAELEQRQMAIAA